MTSARGRVLSDATRYEEVNSLLVDLTERVADILGDNLVGAYLHGSFALGDADMYSDCDFVMTTRSAVTASEESALRALHDEIPTRDGHWTRHLEGSYAVEHELRSLAGLGREWLFIDHGRREMQWSTHCNTEVVRWTLRERGITVFGPEARSVVDVVPPDTLRSRMKSEIPNCLDDLAAWISLDIAWSQRHAVTSLARMLYTLHTAEVASKRAALGWAQVTLDPAWRPLLAQTLEDRPRGFDRLDAPRPGSVEKTKAFARYATDLATGTVPPSVCTAPPAESCP